MDETLVRGLIRIDVDSGEALSELGALTQRVIQELQGLGRLNTPIGQQLAQEANKGFQSVTQLSDALARLRTEMAVPDVKVSASKYLDEVRAVEMLTAKTNELAAAQRARAATASPIAQQEARAIAARENARLQELAAGRSGLAGDAIRQAPISNAQASLGAAEAQAVRAQAELAQSLDRRTQISDQVARLEASRAANIARLSALEQGMALSREKYGKARPQDFAEAQGLTGQIAQEDAELTALKQQAANNYQQVLANTARVEQSEQRIAAASDRLEAAKERAAELAINQQAKVNAAEAKRLAAETKAAEAAEEKARVQQDPRLGDLQERLRQGPGAITDEAGQQGRSLRLQALIIEQQQLVKARERLLASTQSVESEKDLAKLLQQEETLRRRILSNTAAINQQGLRDEGKGGFWGGIMGGFSGQRAQGMEELSFQAGQSVKYFAMYQALSMVQNGMQTLIQTAIELSQAQVDLAVTLGVTTDEAKKQMAEYARLGRQYATGPVEAAQGAGRYARTFREEDGSPDLAAARQGAIVAGLINVLEGQEKIDTVQTDLIALARAFDSGYGGTGAYYDQATFISREYGNATGGEIISGAAAIGDIGKGLGYSPQDLMALIAGVMQQTGVTSDAAAGDIKRFLGEAEAPAMNALFQEFGISLDLSFKERMEELNVQMRGMSEAERTNVLSAAGDARTGAAVAAALASMDRANVVKGRAEEGAPGFASELAKRQLEDLSGSVRELSRELVQIAGALASAGFGDMLVTVVQTTTQVIQSITFFADALSLLPGPMKEFLAFLVAAVAIGKAGSAARGALASSEFMAGFAGAGMGAGGGAGAAGMGSLLSQRGVAMAANDTAKVAALNAQIEATRRATAASSGLTGGLRNMAGGIGHAAKVLGPFIAAIGALALIGEAYDLDQRRRNAEESGRNAGREFDESAAQGNVEAMTNAIALMRTARDEMSDTRDGWQSGVINALSAPQALGGRINAFFTGESDVDQTWHSQIREQEALLDEEIRLKERELAALEAHYAKLNNTSASSEWFGPDFAKSVGGVERIQENGLGAEATMRAFRELGLGAPRLSTATNPEGGIKELYEHWAKQIKRLNNPLEQEEGMAVMQDALRDVRARIDAFGTMAQQDMIAGLVEDFNRAYSDTLVSNAQLKIENIKAMQEEGPAALQLIRGEITEVLQEVGGTGDINATIKLLAGVDAAFLETYRSGLQAQIQILENTMASLDEARRLAASVEMGGERGRVTRNQAEQDRTGQGEYAETRDRLNRMRTALETFDVAKPLSAPKGSAFDWGGGAGGSGPSAQDIEIARLRAQAISGDPVSEAKTNLRVAEYELRNAENQQEYWNAVKAVNDAKHSLAQAQLDASTAAIAESARAGDPLSQASANLRVAQAQLRNATGSAAYSQALQAVEEARLAYSRAQLDISLAAIAASVVPGDPLSAAKANLQTAQRQLSASVSQVEYYNALKSLREAQYELGQLELERAQNARLLRIDITDPVAQANAEVESAKRQLDFNRKRGASQDVLLADQVSLRQAQTNAAQTAWDQQFSDAQTNFNLQRTSLSAYLSYLNSQREYLSAVQNKTRAQVEQLNQVDAALKGITDGMQGQFNLGDINVPSPYEVRRALASEGSYSNTQTVTNVDLTINGADLAQVQALLSQYLGRGVVQSAATLPRR